MKRIGRHFVDELKAAGLYGLAFGWTEDGRLIFEASVTDAQRAAIQAVLDAHDPNAEPPLPDTVEFERQLKTIFADDLAKMNALLAKYPLFLWSLRDKNWAYVQAMLQAAVAVGDIVDPQLTAMRTAASDTHLPISF